MTSASHAHAIFRRALLSKNVKLIEAASRALTTEGAGHGPGHQRDERITRFYLRHADRLRRSIAQKTRGLDDAIIDDACAFAWELLCRRPDIGLDRCQAYWWTYKVARRRAWALGRARRREQPIGGLTASTRTASSRCGLRPSPQRAALSVPHEMYRLQRT